MKDWGQEQFWQLNAFFQGTKLVEKTKQLDDGRRVSTKELVSQPADGPIYFETLSGVIACRVDVRNTDSRGVDACRAVESDVPW